MRILSFTAPALAALLLTTTAALAQNAMQAAPMTAPAPMDNRIDSQGSGAIPTLPLDVESSNGVTYINGGVSDEEVAELKAKEHEFNVHMLLNSPKGDFISDVTLLVVDKSGQTLVSIDDAGPYVYMLLKPGSYTLEASAHGETHKATIKVPKNGVVKKELTFTGEAGGVDTVHIPTATID